MKHSLSRSAVWLLRLPVRVYQLCVSPMMPPSCRHVPSCSEYALEALERHGAVRGSGLAAWRLLRCHPWGSAGFDPVPESRPMMGNGQ